MEDFVSFVFHLASHKVSNTFSSSWSLLGYVESSNCQRWWQQICRMRCQFMIVPKKDLQIGLDASGCERNGRRVTMPWCLCSSRPTAAVDGVEKAI